MSVKEVICPPIPGAFSALGLVGTDLKRDYAKTFYKTTDRVSASDLRTAFDELAKNGQDMLERAGVEPERRKYIRSVDARYERQSYEITVPVNEGEVAREAIQQIDEAFHERHHQTYGHNNRSEPVQIVNVRVTAIGEIPPLTMRQATAGAGTDANKAKRTAWFKATGETEVEVYDRSRMAALAKAEGPCIIESSESTILVPPGWQSEVDDDGFIHLTQRNA